MKNISAALKAHLQLDNTTMCTCWKAVLKNGTTYGFTDHDQDITYLGVLYQASTGFSPTSIATSEALDVNNLEVQGFLSSASIAEADIVAGLWDYAEINIFQVNYNDLTMGEMDMLRGWLGEVKTGKLVFIAEMRSLTQKLQQTLGSLYSPSCRAILGDSKCKVNLAPFTFTSSVTTATNNRQFLATSLVNAANYFDYGDLTWTSGLNNGLSMEVKNYLVGSIELQLPMPYAVQVGDTFSVVAGCNKVARDNATTGVLGNCKGKFNNIINFRGEPDVPNQDALFAGPKP
jgi:uncharacterized phage protein (TIGR02218 family)